MRRLRISEEFDRIFTTETLITEYKYGKRRSEHHCPEGLNGAFKNARASLNIIYPENKHIARDRDPIDDALLYADMVVQLIPFKFNGYLYDQLHKDIRLRGFCNQIQTNTHQAHLIITRIISESFDVKESSLKPVESDCTEVNFIKSLENELYDRFINMLNSKEPRAKLFSDLSEAIKKNKKYSDTYHIMLAVMLELGLGTTRSYSKAFHHYCKSKTEFGIRSAVRLLEDKDGSCLLEEQHLTTACEQLSETLHYLLREYKPNLCGTRHQELLNLVIGVLEQRLNTVSSLHCSAAVCMEQHFPNETPVVLDVARKAANGLDEGNEYYAEACFLTAKYLARLGDGEAFSYFEKALLVSDEYASDDAFVNFMEIKRSDIESDDGKSYWEKLCDLAVKSESQGSYVDCFRLIFTRIGKESDDVRKLTDDAMAFGFLGAGLSYVKCLGNLTLHEWYLTTALDSENASLQGLVLQYIYRCAKSADYKKSNYTDILISLLLNIETKIKDTASLKYLLKYYVINNNQEKIDEYVIKILKADRGQDVDKSVVESMKAMSPDASSMTMEYFFSRYGVAEPLKYALPEKGASTVVVKALGKKLSSKQQPIFRDYYDAAWYVHKQMVDALDPDKKSQFDIKLLREACREVMAQGRVNSFVRLYFAIAEQNRLDSILSDRSTKPENVANLYLEAAKALLCQLDNFSDSCDNKILVYIIVCLTQAAHFGESDALNLLEKLLTSRKQLSEEAMPLVGIYQAMAFIYLDVPEAEINFYNNIASMTSDVVDIIAGILQDNHPEESIRKILDAKDQQENWLNNAKTKISIVKILFEHGVSSENIKNIFQQLSLEKFDVIVHDVVNCSDVDLEVRHAVLSLAIGVARAAPKFNELVKVGGFFEGKFIKLQKSIMTRRDDSAKRQSMRRASSGVSPKSELDKGWVSLPEALPSPSIETTDKTSLSAHPGYFASSPSVLYPQQASQVSLEQVIGALTIQCQNLQAIIEQKPGSDEAVKATILLQGMQALITQQRILSSVKLISPVPSAPPLESSEAASAVTPGGSPKG